MRVDFGLAQLCALLAETHRDSKKRSEPFSIDDFLPKWDKPKGQAKKLDPYAIRAKMIAAFGPPKRRK